MNGHIATKVEKTVDGARDAASGTLSQAGTAIREGSRKAARAIGRGGKNAAETLDNTAARVDSHGHRGVPGYARSHPGRVVFFAALVAGGIALLFIRHHSAASLGYDDRDL